MKNPFESIRSERQLKSLTGLGQQKIDQLLTVFSEAIEEFSNENYRKNRDKRSRRPGGGSKGKLPTPEEKLFFILFYLKNYPTFDVLGFIFDLNPSKAEENVKKLLPVLKRAQSKLNILPRRVLKTSDDLVEAFENMVLKPELPSNSPETTSGTRPEKSETKPTKEKEVVNTPNSAAKMAKTKPFIAIDVTERAHFRHKNNRKQKRHYSGKKKMHSIKNTVASSSYKHVLFLGKTFPGSTHDYKMFKKEFSKDKDWFSNVNVSVDLGYQGIKTDYYSPENIDIPNKKPRKSKKNPNPSLTKKQKAENKKIGAKRVVAEHTIGGMKAFHILSHKFRNRMNGMVDEVIFQVAGLWNLKIST